ncbi:MAG: hypothetical protein KGZ25_00320 [Planctomycetes bacterium]|nr:hypothetical protein [Planctomycetota bacterium]
MCRIGAGQGNYEAVKRFYDAKYGDWKELSPWSKESNRLFGNEWKSWSSKDVYFIVGLENTGDETIFVFHQYSNKGVYEGMIGEKKD